MVHSKHFLNSTVSELLFRNQITRYSNDVRSFNNLYFLFALFFSQLGRVITIQYFTAEVSKKSSLILKLSFAVQFKGRQANVSSELPVMLFLDEKQTKNEFKDPKQALIHTGGFGREM